jgi:hypothetical protein
MQMDLERFRERVNDLRRTRAELIQMLDNVKGNAEFAAIAKAALDTRFAGWDKVSHKAAGARSTQAIFRKESRWFPTSREAYLWLLEKFINANPDLIHHTIFKGLKRDRFAHEPDGLFHSSPELAESPSNYARLSNGWCTDMNLDNSTKLDILCFAAVIAGIPDQEWQWQVEDPSNDLSANIERKARVKQLLAKFK